MRPVEAAIRAERSILAADTSLRRCSKDGANVLKGTNLLNLIAAPITHETREAKRGHDSLKLSAALKNESQQELDAELQEYNTTSPQPHQSNLGEKPTKSLEPTTASCVRQKVAYIELN